MPLGLLSTDMSAPPAYFPAPVVKPISSSPNLEFGQEKLEVFIEMRGWFSHHKESRDAYTKSERWFWQFWPSPDLRSNDWILEDGPITARHVKTLPGKIPSLECSSVGRSSKICQPPWCFPTEPATCVVERSMKSLVDCLCLELFSTGEKNHLKLNCHIREMGPQYHWKKQYFAYRKFSKNYVFWFKPIWILAK